MPSSVQRHSAAFLGLKFIEKQPLKTRCALASATTLKNLLFTYPPPEDILLGLMCHQHQAKLLHPQLRVGSQPHFHLV